MPQCVECTVMDTTTIRDSTGREDPFARSIPAVRTYYRPIGFPLRERTSKWHAPLSLRPRAIAKPPSFVHPLSLPLSLPSIPLRPSTAIRTPYMRRA